MKEKIYELYQALIRKVYASEIRQNLLHVLIILRNQPEVLFVLNKEEVNKKHNTYW